MHFTYYYRSPFNANFAIVIIVLVVAVLLMLCFLGKQNRGKFHGFLGKLYDFLNFRSFTIAAIIKFIYLFVALMIAFSFLLNAFDYGFGGFLATLLGLLLSEVLVRVMFELIMMVVVGVTNVIEINDKLGGASDRPNFVDPDTTKYADKISKGANALGEKIKETAENITKDKKEDEEKPE